MWALFKEPTFKKYLANPNNIYKNIRSLTKIYKKTLLEIFNMENLKINSYLSKN